MLPNHRGGGSALPVPRIERERRHALRILEFDEAHWGWSSRAGQIRRARPAAFLAAEPSSELKVLELGWGTGTFTADLARGVPRLIAIDVAETLLAVTRFRCPTSDRRGVDPHGLTF